MAKMSVDGKIKPDTGHDSYLDWTEDDTERDPTPSNKRRNEMHKSLKPVPAKGYPDSHGKINTKGTTSAAYKAGLPEGD